MMKGDRGRERGRGMTRGDRGREGERENKKHRQDQVKNRCVCRHTLALKWE